jgi:hypothetical protein
MSIVRNRNLPVHPYDGPTGRDVTGQWVDDSARRAYQDDLAVLVEDAQEIVDDLDRLVHGLRHVGHVATREVVASFLRAAQQMVEGAREAIRDEAQS